MGFRVVRAFVKKRGLIFRSGKIGELAQEKRGDKRVILLLPMTFMNKSGQAVRLCSDYFGIAVSHTLVVCDDIALPFGKIRFRQEGSAGGHNGLKSVEAHLGTPAYPRLRVGISDRQHGDLADYVLGKFSAEELAALPEVMEKALSRIDVWLEQGSEAALRMNN